MDMSQHSLADKRLYWQCRRGLLELDLILQTFMVAQGLCLTATEKVALHALLLRSDQELQGLFLRGGDDAASLTVEEKQLIEKVRAVQ